MALATLSIDLVAKLANLSEGLDKATRLSQKAANDIENQFKKISGVATSLGLGIASAFSVDVIRTFVTATVDAIDAMNDVADATGASVENISALDDVARRTGTTLEVAAAILVKFNNGLKEADGKNGISLALKAIGLDAEQLKKIDPAEALRQTAVALAGFADDGNKARLVQELFGKSIKDAAPFLKDLSEQTRLNGTVTKEAADEAERFNKNIFALQANVNELARSVVNAMVPAINSLIERFREGSKEGKGFFGNVIAEYERVARAQREFLGLQQGFTDGRGGSTRASVTPSGSSTRPALYGSSGYGDMSRPSLPSLPAGTRGSAAKKPYSDYIGDAERDFQKRVQDWAEKNQETLDKFEARDPIGEAEADFQRRIDDFAERNQVALDKVQQQDLDKIAADAQLARDQIQDQLGTSLRDALRGDFDKISDDWENLMLEIVARAAETQLKLALFGKDGKSGLIGAGLNTLLTTLFSANGNAFGPGGVIPFANGGVVNGATMFGYGNGKAGVMGEAGPEAILPLKRGPGGKLGVAGGGGTTIINNVAAGVTRSELMAALQQTYAASTAHSDNRLRKLGFS